MSLTDQPAQAVGTCHCSGVSVARSARRCASSSGKRSATRTGSSGRISASAIECVGAQCAALALYRRREVLVASPHQGDVSVFRGRLDAIGPARARSVRATATTPDQSGWGWCGAAPISRVHPAHSRSPDTSCPDGADSGRGCTPIETLRQVAPTLLMKSPSLYMRSRVGILSACRGDGRLGVWGAAMGNMGWGGATVRRLPGLTGADGAWDTEAVPRRLAELAQRRDELTPRFEQLAAR